MSTAGSVPAPGSFNSSLQLLFSAALPEAGDPLVDLHALLFSTGARHVLEFGAGTGIVAITLTVLRSTLDLDASENAGSIVTTDLASVIPILRHNIISNRALTPKCTPEVAILGWGDEEPRPEVQAQLEVGVDVIVMADVTYNTASFVLIATLSRLVHHCKQLERRNGHPLWMVMCYKERHPDE